LSEIKHAGGKMDMVMSRDEIFEKVKDVLVDALGVDDEEVTNDATLMKDLGAESIDFLDIVFRLEKAFEIKVPREELFPAENIMNSSELVSNGKLTEKGLAELRERLPHMNLTDFEKDPDVNKLGDLFTVGAIVNFIDNKINAN
jgi:acyl carrier protein